MSGKSKIEWTDTTWNPLHGCSDVSAGCTNCYAKREAHIHASHPNAKLAARFEGLTRISGGKICWTGKINLHEDKLVEPLHWKKPRRVFVNSQSDLFHEAVPFEFVDKVFAIMALCPQHIFQVLTKRPERMAEYFARKEPITVRPAWFKALGAMIDAMPEVPSNYHGLFKDRKLEYWENQLACAEGTDRPFVELPDAPLKNVWLGTSVENQKEADTRIPHLLRCPAAVRFLSCEPLLGPVDLVEGWEWLDSERYNPCKCGDGECSTCWQVPAAPTIHWVIAGGESGPGARPMHPDWPRSLRDQCAVANVPFFFKQWGAYNYYPAPEQIDSSTFLVPGYTHRKMGKHEAGRTLDGKTHDGFPGQEVNADRADEMLDEIAEGRVFPDV